jgi:uncharacterized RDD family membrane protein YckC
MKNETQHAGFWIRAIADCFDSILLDLVAALTCLIVLGAVYWVKVLFHAPDVDQTSSLLNQIGPFALQILFVVIRVSLSVVYFTYATYVYGTTLAKRLFRIYVVTADQGDPLTLKQSLTRCLAYTVSYAPLGAGFLMAAFQPEKRALHDLLAGTLSVVRQPETLAVSVELSS